MVGEVVFVNRMRWGKLMRRGVRLDNPGGRACINRWGMGDGQ